MAKRVKQARSTVRRQRGYTRVSPKHQVTLPKDVLIRAGLTVGDRLLVTTQRSGEVVLQRQEDAIDRYAGQLGGVFPAGYLDQLRDEWG